MSAKIDDKRRLKFAAQGLRKTAISLQAAVVSLLQTADALSAETDDNLVENNPLDVNLQDLLKGDINSALIKLLNNALNSEGEVDDDQRAQNGKRAANGVKKSTRKPRPPRDPNAPTKPQNAFILFQKEIAAQVKAENPDKQWPEIVHLISARWKALSKDEKEKYDHRYEEAKQTYETAYRNYMEKKNKDQVVVAAVDEVLEENNDTSGSASPDSQSSASQSDEEDEEDIPNTSNSRSSRSKVKSAKNATHPNPESSSKKKSRKRKTQEDDDDESVNEEEEHYELSKKSKKKASNEEGSEVQGKERKKSNTDGKLKKKKSKKNRQD